VSVTTGQLADRQVDEEGARVTEQHFKKPVSLKCICVNLVTKQHNRKPASLKKLR
jgi:hypothetical protein